VIVVVVDNLTCVETRKRPKRPSQFLLKIEAARSVEEDDCNVKLPDCCRYATWLAQV
jgi:hypothetical protein